MPPGTANVTSASSSPAFSEMIAAGRACRPTDEPTFTVMLAIYWFLSRGLQLGVDERGLVDGRGRAVVALQRDDERRGDDGAGDEGDEERELVVDGEQHEDPAVGCVQPDVEQLGEPACHGAADHD